MLFRSVSQSRYAPLWAPFSLERDEKGLVKGATIKRQAANGRALPTRPAARTMGEKSWSKIIEDNQPLATRSAGDSRYAVTDTMDMKGAGIMKHPQAPAGENVVIVDRKQKGYEELRVGDRTELAGKNFVVVYTTANRVVVKEEK